MKCSVIASAALVLALAAPGWAAPPKTIEMPASGGTLIVPAASPLHLHGFNKDGWAQFDGVVTLTGTYHIGMDVYGQGDSKLSLIFIPDAATKALLPRFKQPETDLGWTIENPDAFAAAVVPKDRLVSLHNPGAPVVTGKVGIKVDHVTIWAICGNANVSARFVAVATPPQPFKAPELDAPDC